MSALSTSETREPYRDTASVARLTKSMTSSHSPSISVNIDEVRFGKPESRTTFTAAATASCTEASWGVGPLMGTPEGATENATSMGSVWHSRGPGQQGNHRTPPPGPDPDLFTPRGSCPGRPV